jgi:hypothetical protein
MKEEELEKCVVAFLKDRFSNLDTVPRCAVTYAAGTADPQEFRVDILLREPRPKLTPRVAIELKSGGVSTHDLLTYSAKASLHRSLHGYLRYGLFVAGDGSKGISAKWLWHGQAFDFMLSCRGDKPKTPELNKLAAIVKFEIDMSRRVEAWVNQKRGPWPQIFWRRAEIEMTTREG